MTLSKVVDEVNKISEGVVTSVLSDEYLNQESDEGEDNDINDVETDGGWLLSYTWTAFYVFLRAFARILFPLNCF